MQYPNLVQQLLHQLVRKYFKYQLEEPGVDPEDVALKDSFDDNKQPPNNKHKMDPVYTNE